MNVWRGMMERMKQGIAGAGALLAAGADYLCFRDWDNMLGNAVRQIDVDGGIEETLRSVPNFLGEANNWMPDYLGTLGMGCIGSALSARRGMQRAYIGAVVGVNVLSELLQNAGVLNGSYDTKDILAYLAGGLSAAAIGKITGNSRRS